MPNTIPHFKSTTKRESSIAHKGMQCGHIEIDGKFICQIEDLDKFYKVFGYTSGMAKAGILPDEFIWSEYVMGRATYSSCYQMHMIEYLKMYSDSFRKEYGAQCDEWIAAHMEEKNNYCDMCVTCKMQPFCSVCKN